MKTRLASRYHVFICLMAMMVSISLVVQVVCAEGNKQMNMKIRRAIEEVRSDSAPRNDDVLMEALRDPDIQASEKAMLIAELKTEAKATFSTNHIPSTLRNLSIPAGAVSNLTERLQELQTLEKSVADMPHEKRASVAGELHAKQIDIALALEKSGHPELAYVALLIAHSHEEALGFGGSESSVVSYVIGQFEERLKGNGRNLLRVLRAKEIPSEVKKSILVNLDEAASRGDLPSQ